MLAWIAFTVWYTTGPGHDGNWFEGWNRWDGFWYGQIWREGYGNDPHTLVFMPAFPWLAGAVSTATTLSFSAACTGLNLVSYFIGGVLAAEFLSRRFAVSAPLVFGAHLAAPAAFYAFMPYSDALFYAVFWLAITIGDRSPETLTRAQRRVAWLVLFLLPTVRLTGFALGAWVLFRRWYALAVLATLALVLATNSLKAHDAFFFLSGQEDFQMPSGWFVHGLVYHWRELFKFPREPAIQQVFWLETTALPLLSLAFAVFAAFWLSRRRELLLALTIVSIAVFSRNQSFWRSVGRYDLPLTLLILLPWLSWSCATKATRARYFVQALGVIVVSCFVIAGLFIQWSLGRGLHAVGQWAF